MTRFEDLPDNIRALILAKLAMELRMRGGNSLHDLARRQQTDVVDAWRRICRLSGQPVCTIPAEAVQSHR
jgi:hypothetical protein